MRNVSSGHCSRLFRGWSIRMRRTGALALLVLISARNGATQNSGQEEYERLRPLSYAKSHVILIAFAIDTPDSLENVSVKVAPSPTHSFRRADGWL
jgi:GTPase SAR1 family protein